MDTIIDQIDNPFDLKNLRITCFALEVKSFRAFVAKAPFALALFDTEIERTLTFARSRLAPLVQTLVLTNYRKESKLPYDYRYFKEQWTCIHDTGTSTTATSIPRPSTTARA